MYSETNEIFDKEILITRQKPFYFYLTVSLWSILVVLFITVIKIRELDYEGVKAVFFIFLFFIVYVYIIFGRYLAHIKLYNHHIEINYVFPWNKPQKFSFETLAEIEFREFDLIDRLSRKWYRGGKWLYLKNKKGEGFQFKYSINSSENEKLLEKLQKMCSTEIVYDY